MADRVKVTEAARTTGVPGPAIFLAIRHGEIRAQLTLSWVPEGARRAPPTFLAV
jgi:hypothetical protein